MSARPAPATRLSPAAQWTLRLGMALAGPLLLLLLLEGFAYVWERQQANGPYAWELVASRRIQVVDYPQPGAGYTLMRPGSHYVYQGITVDVNSRGLREREVGNEPPAGAWRILNVGDSVAMGWGVPLDASYGHVLEAQLNEAGRGPVEVVNGAVHGWNVANELAYLEAEGFGYHPGLILLDLTLANDIYGGSAVNVRGGRVAAVEWLRDHTYFWPFLTIEYRWIEAKSQGKARIAVIDPPHEASQYFPLDSQAEPWTRMRNWLAELGQTAKAHGLPAVVVLFPLEDQVLDPAYSILPQQLLAEDARQAGLTVVDLLPAFQSACQAKPGGPCQLEDRYLFADVWMHPSVLGHQIAAAEIARSLPAPATR